MVTGNIGIPGVLFNLTLRAWEPVDFSNRHPPAGKEQATRDAAVRDGAVLQELIMNKHSELVRLSLFGYLGPGHGAQAKRLVWVPSSGSRMRTCPGRSWGHDSSSTVHS